MGKNGYKVMDSDLHVLEPADLYTTYMDPKWGDRDSQGGTGPSVWRCALHYGPGRTNPADAEHQRPGP